MNIQNHVAHQVAAQKDQNRQRLNLYTQRREIYLRHLGDGCKVSFPLIPVINEVSRYGI